MYDVMDVNSKASANFNQCKISPDWLSKRVEMSSSHLYFAYYTYIAFSYYKTSHE